MIDGPVDPGPFKRSLNNGADRVLTGSISNTNSVRKYAPLTKNRHAKTKDVKSNAIASLGGVLGTRADVIVGRKAAVKAELELV